MYKKTKITKITILITAISQTDSSVKSEATMDPIHIATNVNNIAELPLDALYWQRIV